MSLAGTNTPLPRCCTLAIGTLPLTDVDEAVDTMLEFFPECPTWPQLPQLDFREAMYVQYAEGMPAAVIEEKRERVVFDIERAPADMAEFYERYLAGDIDVCAITRDFAAGLDALLARMPSPGARFLKGQVTGPISFGLTVTDAENKPVLYHADLFEAVVNTLACKGAWQVRRFREAAPDLAPVIFYDEPYLTQMGSAMISLAPEQITGSLNTCFEAVDGLTGTHVCGGTDWGLLMGTQVDILHFDAAEHEREFFLYEKELAGFLERGGILAWGIVQTDEGVLERNARQLAEQLEAGAEKAAAIAPAEIGIQEVLERSFISQSCGMGSREPEVAHRCLELAAEVSKIFTKQL